MNAYDLCERNPPLCRPTRPSMTASELMGIDGLEEIPVVDRLTTGNFSAW